MRNENYDDSSFNSDRYDEKREKFLNQNRKNDPRSYDDAYDQVDRTFRTPSQEHSYLQGERPFSNEYNFKENNSQIDDKNILKEISAKLNDSPYIDNSNIGVKVLDGEVELQGYVESRKVKHFVEDLIDNTHDVKDVHNHLKIKH